MSKITDWSAVMSTPAFWAIYYCNKIDPREGEDKYALIQDIFSCDSTKIEALYDVLMGCDEDPAGVVEGVEWNVLTIPFPEGYEWQIEFNTVPGIYHTLVHAGFPKPLRLGRDDPHFMLPLLRCVEVAPLAVCVQRHGAAAFDPRVLYPLLYPLAVPTQADDLSTVRQELIQAWADFGLLPPEKVALLVNRVTGVDDSIRWWRDETLGWTTDACYSYRNTDNRWTAADFARWNAFLELVLRCADKQGEVL
jgi:hypothetical protein